MPKIKTPILIIIIIIVILIALALIFNGFKSSKQTNKADIPQEVYGISGTIKDIRSNSLIINALLLWDDPSTEPIRQDIEVLVNEQTKITKLEFPKPEALTKEQIEKGFQAKETEIKLSDLKKDDTINIVSEQNVSTNLKNKTPFTASAINVVNQ